MSRMNNQRDPSDNPNRNRSLYLFNIIFLSCLTIASLLFALFVFFRLRTRGTDGVRQFYTRGQISKIEETAARNARDDLLLEIQSSLESGRSTTQMLREIFSDSIVVVSGGRYYFYPLAEDVEKNPLMAGDLTAVEGRVSYGGEDHAVQISHGVLLSDNNGKIDWGRLADSGIEEVTVSAGILNEKRFVPDQNFERNCRYAVEKGKRVSISLEVQGPAGRESVEEAMAAVGAVTDVYGLRDLPEKDMDQEKVSADRDSEDESGTQPEPGAGDSGDSAEGSDGGEKAGENEPAGGREGSIDPLLVLRIRTAEELSDDGKDEEAWTDCIEELCRAADDEEIRPVIGAGLFTSAAQIDMEALAGRERWLIDHEETASYPYSYSFWEYSAEGSMEGVPGKAVLYARIDISGLTE